MDKYNLYDNIIKATYINIAIDAINNKGIYFNNFDKKSYAHKVFLKVAFMVSDFEEQNIYLNCNCFDFLKILFNNYNIKKIITGKCTLHFSRHKHDPDTDIDTVAIFEAKEFQTDISIFEKIWKEYYEERKE